MAGLIAFRVDETLFRLLKKEAEKRGVSMTHIIKSGICLELGLVFVPEHYEKPKKEKE